MTYTTTVRTVGGSVMLALPPELLGALNLRSGATVDLTVEGDTIVVKTQMPPRYTLEELLAASDYSTPRTEDETAWINAPAVGRELI